jgi:receptor protein-tyrosine kinase
MAAKTASQLGHGLTTRGVSDALNVSAQGDTNVVNVSATSTSRRVAAQIANTYSTIFVSEQENADHQYYVSALATVEQQLAKLPAAARPGALGLSLEDRAQTLSILAVVPSGSVQIAAVASIPTAPSSPKVVRNAILGAILGILLGLGGALLLERLDQRIRDPKELEDIYGLPLLGVVPQSSVFSRATRGGNSPRTRLPTREAEAFQFIRAHLRFFAVDRPMRTLLVTSASSGDGKTTIAKNLSVAAAQTGSRVLLIEADLRRPTLARQLGVQPAPGLIDVLITASPPAHAIQLVELAALSGETAAQPTFAVLVAGATPPPNPAQLLESQAMDRILTQAHAAYDLIVLDTAPLAAVSDTFPLLRRVDGVIIVGRLGYDRRDVARRLRHTLDGGGSPLLGVIANSVKARRNSTYGYGYDS